MAASALLGFAAGEGTLRFRRGQIERSDKLDPGLTVYDDRLGWVLAANWRGRHRNHDFDVGYATNARGFRGPIEAAGAPAALWLGDSFTFGLGVDDGATFVDRLDGARAGGLRHANLAVPGYSTDQQALLLERRLPAFDARFIGLVVYLGNDLIDNLLAYPLQAATAKPYFELRGGELALRSSPVPRNPKPAAELARGFGPRLFGMADVTPGALDRALASSETVRWLGIERPPAPDDFEARLEAALEPSIALFTALVRRLQLAGKPLAIVLIASRRHLLAPGSWAARYQEVARRRLRDASFGVPVIDLAERFRSAASANRLHHPHEGHFTVRGHEVAAKTIAERTLK